MTRQPFVRSLAAAAVLALGAVPWQLVVGPVVGIGAAAALFALATPPLYLAAVASSPRRGLRAFGVASVLVGAAFALGLWLGSTMISLVGAAVALAVTRSLVFRRQAAARAVALETALLVAGALVAQMLAADPWLGPGLALWGFYLVQSCYFLVADGGARQAEDAAALDPFDRARGRLEILLSDDGVG